MMESSLGQWALRGYGVFALERVADGSFIGFTGFHDAPEVHHQNAPADMFHHRQVMRNKKIRQPMFALQIDQQVSQSARANPKNGRATIDLTASFTPPATVPGDQIGCPNGRWTGINPVVISPVSATGTITWQGQQLFQQTISPVTP